MSYLGGVSSLSPSQSTTVKYSCDRSATTALSLHGEARRSYERYIRSEHIEDLQDYVTTMRIAMDSLPHMHPDKQIHASHLYHSLHVLFIRFGSLDVLDEGVAAATYAAELIPCDHPHLLYKLSDLGTVLHLRFEYAGALKDLEQAITKHTRALQLAPEGHPGRPFLLDSLANSQHSRFKRLKHLELVDLNEAVDLKTRAVNLIPAHHSHKPILLESLGQSLQLRFEQWGDPHDLREAIALKSRAVDVTVEDHQRRSLFMESLAISLLSRFEQSGNITDLERAIDLTTRSLQPIPDGHTHLLSKLGRLGTLLHARYQELGNVVDLEEAIKLKSRAVDSTPDGHTDKSCRMESLACSLRSRFQRFGDLGDLNEAINLKTRALEQTPDGHRDKAPLLVSLGATLGLRFSCLEDLQDLVRSIELQTSAVDLTPNKDPYKPSHLTHLRVALETQYDFTQDLASMQQAMTVRNQADRLASRGHLSRVVILSKSSRTIPLRIRRFSSWIKVDELTQAMASYLLAMQEESRHPYQRLFACLDYIDLLSHPNSVHSPEVTELQAHEQILTLVQKILGLGPDVHARNEEAARLSPLINGAVADAIAVGEHERAIEWLENCRTMTLDRHSQRLSTPLDDLRTHHPALAEDLHRVSQACHANRSEIENLHELTLEYECLLTRVRELRGFEDFLRPKKIAQLMGACAPGPVVIINVHYSRCDALVLCQREDVTHIPLPWLSYDRAIKLQDDMLQRGHMLEKSARASSDGRDPVRMAARVPSSSHGIHNILADLWTGVVLPITEGMGHLLTRGVDGKLPHITWYPTGPLITLPIHAAGIYKEGEPSLTAMDFAVSSYTTSLEAILRPRIRVPETSFNQYPKILVVCRPYSVQDHRPIPEVLVEAEIIVSLFGQSTDVFKDGDATVETVLEGMSTHDWFHFAGHTTQETTSPLDNALEVSDGRIASSILMSQSFQNAELAFLSSCKTAAVDHNLPEQADHLVAALLNAGYKSVVGAMWSIRDADARVVAERFYHVMSNQVASGGELRPAYALHEAIDVLRGNCALNGLMRWIPFVHFGL